MTKRASWQCCACERYGTLVCQWPVEGGVCGKKVCRWCSREIEGARCCPYHRGDPPHVAARKQREAEEEARQAGEREAENARRILGLGKAVATPPEAETLAAKSPKTDGDA